MKWTAQLAAGLAFTSALAAATPLASRQDAGDSANDWDPILNGDDGATCADVAVIFARGTFDSGNMGVWVGPSLKESLQSKHNSLAFQGVDATAYPADMAGYIEEGGSQSGADSMADTVKKYSEKCPDAKIAMVGWSQGALVTHKAVGSLGDTADKVSAFAVFGDPLQRWKDQITYPAIPDNMKQLSYCESDITDPLCGSLIDDLPTSIGAFIDTIKKAWGEVEQTDVNETQWQATLDLITTLPGALWDESDQLVKDLWSGDMNRIMRYALLPQHFFYGVDGTTQTTADDILSAFGA